MQERLNFGPDFDYPEPVIVNEIPTEEVVEKVAPEQLRFFILDRFVETK